MVRGLGFLTASAMLKLPYPDLGVTRGRLRGYISYTHKILRTMRGYDYQRSRPWSCLARVKVLEKGISIMTINIPVSLPVFSIGFNGCCY